MARVRKGGTFVPNPMGYREVMNGRGMLMHCQTVGEQMAASAAAQDGIAYETDSIQGLNRIHTRVKTPADWRSYMREGHYGALAIAAGSRTGGTFSTRTLGSALKAARNSKSTWKAVGSRGWTANTKGWKSIAGDRLAYSVKRAARGR